jgi:hypothetical protein
VLPLEFQGQEGSHDLGETGDLPLVALAEAKLGVVVLVEQAPAS